MNRLWDLIARVVVFTVWVPVDRTVCRWSQVTHVGRDAS